MAFGTKELKGNWLKKNIILELRITNFRLLKKSSHDAPMLSHPPSRPSHKLKLPSGRYPSVQLHLASSNLDDQTDPTNYTYDAIGNLTGDAAEGIDVSKIEWTVYGKIKKIVKRTQIANVTTLVTIEYEYDASGNRIYKKVDNKE